MYELKQCLNPLCNKVGFSLYYNTEFESELYKRKLRTYKCNNCYVLFKTEFEREYQQHFHYRKHIIMLANYNSNSSDIYYYATNNSFEMSHAIPLTKDNLLKIIKKIDFINFE